MSKSIVEQFGEIIQPILKEGEDPVSVAITTWINERIEVAKQVLQDNDKNASRSLTQSIEATPIEKEGLNFQIRVLADEYWDFVNSGVDGTEVKRGAPYSYKDKQPPKETIRQWMFDRSITTQQYIDSTGAKKIKQLTTEQERDGLAFAIGRSIKKKGTKATPFMDIAFNQEALNDLENRILEAWQLI